MAKKRGLGKGLGALMKDANTAAVAVAEPTSAIESADLEQISAASAQQSSTDLSAANQQLADIAVEHICRGRYQPRRDIAPEALEELAASIRQQGIMQPIVLRSISSGRYEIIAGERRWRAAQLAGLEKVPAIIREVSDEAAIAMALIENIQREDLGPIEEAVALKRLQDEFELTQQEVAEAVGKSRSAVANLLRLLQLAEPVRTMLERGDLEMGHARALLALPEAQQLEAARLVVAKGLSVRQTEELVRKLRAQREQKSSKKTADPDILKLEERLGECLGAVVKIQHTANGKGKLVIHYSSLDELDGVLDHIK